MVKGFTFEDEKAFRNSNQFIQPKFLRVAYLLFIALFTLFGITDSVYLSDYLVIVYIIRFAIVVPTFIIVIVFTYMNSFVRIHQLLISTSVMIGGLAVVFMLILNPGNVVYYGGLFLVYFSSYFIIKLRFVNASIVGWSLYILHMIGYFIWNSEINDIFIYSSLFFIVANVLGMVGAYNVEVMNRKNFLHNQQISKLNQELKLNYDEKASQLEKLEKSIRENKELIAINAEKDRLTETLLKSETRFRELVYNLNAGVVIYAADATILDINHRAFEILGFQEQDIKGKKTKEFGFVYIDEKRNLIEPDKYPLSNILSSKKELKNLIMGIVRQNSNEVSWVIINGHPIFDSHDEIIEVVVSFIDYNELKDAQDQLIESEEKYKALATQMQLGLALHEVILDEQGVPIDYIFLDINDSYTRLTGITREMCIGKKISEVMPRVEDYWIKTLGNVAVTGESTYYENYLGTTDKYYSTYTYSPQKGQFAVIVTDITDRKQLEDALHDSNEKYKAIFEKSPISIEYYDADGKFIQANEACLTMFGVLDRNELEGYNLFDNPNLNQELKDKIAKFESVHVELEFSFEKVISSKVYRTSKTGLRVLDLIVTPIMKDDQLSGYLVHIEDITIEKHKQKEIEYLSYHDYLTDLYNRRYFVHSYHQFVFEEKFPLGVMMIDINGLKIINDAYGHNQGDQAIKLVSGLFRKVFDPMDIVARIGGDEFAILAPNKYPEQMQDYKNKIIELVKNLNIGNIEISLAIGYEVVTDVNRDIDELLSQAENFLYRHKITVGTSIRNHAIKAILNTLTDKYADEKVHSERVSQYCRAIGLELGFSKEEADVLELAGMYHDIGKISIPDAILNKPGKLTNEEFEIIKSHTQVGYQILKAADEYSGLAEYALSHHERWDGKGYPKGLKGNEIPLYSRIINVADSFEAMTADRPYHKGRSLQDAIEEIRRCSGTQFDPEIAAVFINKVVK
ncbi:MAG: diguanylate cyclase [Acholeplasmataceae bacterium]|nr:diguanylate cyclase [Acholeplasmataceae bacterium]